MKEGDTNDLGTDSLPHDSRHCVACPLPIRVMMRRTVEVEAGWLGWAAQGGDDCSVDGCEADEA